MTLSPFAITGLSLVGTMYYDFDSNGKQFRKRYVDANGAEQKYLFEFRDDQNVAVQLPTNVVSHAKSDHLGRKVFDELQLGKGLMNRKFTYHEGKVSDTHEANDKKISDPQTTLVKQIEFADGRTIQYEYDAEERITFVKDSVEGNTAYEYDALGQLTKEIKNAAIGEQDEIAGDIVEFEYDQYGNITKKYNKTYTYGKYYVNNVIGGTVEKELGWKDLLTYYNGQRIDYDDNGNPTNYLGTSATWEKGRQLKTLGTNTYWYNKDGIRTKKAYDGKTHTYTLDGTNIIKEKVTGSTPYTAEYFYDLDGTACGLKYGGNAYYFYKNLQGDVIAITDNAGTVIARYTYDAWGKVLSVTDANGNAITSATHVANINPFRYRSYYYDAETKLYYLQSRYYDPEVGRFLNADAKIPSENDEKQSSNLFSYACNNPVNESDLSGYIAVFLAKKIGSVVVNAVIGVLAQFLGDVIMSALRKEWKFSSLGTYISAVLKGAWDGLWGGGIAKEICKSMLSNLLSQLIDWIHKKKAFDFVGLLSSVLDGIFTYVIGKIVKIPKYIREIKKAALEHGLKGTKKLMEYLNKVIWQRLSITLTLSGISNFVTQVVSEIINYAIECAIEIYNNLKKDIGGLVDAQC